MSKVDLIFAIFFFVVYNIVVFTHGYNVGFNAAIDQMKKVRNRK